MSRTIYTALGAIEDVSVDIDSGTVDLTGATYQLSVGTYTSPGAWRTPDNVTVVSTTPAITSVVASLTIGIGHLNPVAATYWMWYQVSVGGKVIIRPVRSTRFTVTDVTGTVINPAITYAHLDSGGHVPTSELPDLSAIYAATARGLPAGGSTAQVLKKNSATNYDVSWGAAGGTAFVLDARNYGTLTTDGTGTGATNATTIQAAIDAAAFAISGLSGNDVPSYVVELPVGRIAINVSLKMIQNVKIRGQHEASTYLLTKTSTMDALALKLGTEVQCSVENLGIIYNGGGTPTAGAGINLNGSQGASILGDARHMIRNVVIVGMYDGVVASGNSETRLSQVTVQRPIHKGIYSTATDMFIGDCTVGQPGDIGIDLAGGNSRMWGTKVFGGSNAGVPHFNIQGAGRDEVGICESQDAPGDAFNISGTFSTLVACIADSCGGVGFSDGFVGAPGNLRIEGCITLYRSGGAHVPTAGAKFQNVRDCTVHLTCVDQTGTNPFPALHASTSGAAGSYEINNIVGWQALAYAATITPDPWLGGNVVVGALTGALTINAPAPLGGGFIPPGTRLTFVIPQDGTGGRVVTFNSIYKNVGTLDTTASSTTVLAFVFDGTNWQRSNASAAASTDLTGLVPMVWKSGEYRTGILGGSGSAGSVNQFPAQNSGMFMPLECPGSYSIDRIGVQVDAAGAAGVVIRFGVYADDGNSRPGTLIAEAASTVAGDTTGYVEATITAALSRGRYHCIAVAQGTGNTPGLRYVNAYHPMLGAASGSNAIGASNVQISTNGSISGALPSTVTLNTSFGNRTPVIAVRIV